MVPSALALAYIVRRQSTRRKRVEDEEYARKLASFQEHLHGVAPSGVRRQSGRVAPAPFRTEGGWSGDKAWQGEEKDALERVFF